MRPAALVAVLAVVAVLAAQGSPAARRQQLISFWSDRAGYPGVWVMNADGSSPRLVSGRVAAKRGSWSPDGRRLVFDGPVNVREGEATQDLDLYVADVSGLRRRRLTRGPERDVVASWSPEGRWIAFTRRRTRAAREEIWLVRPDGSGARRLTAGSGPVWSPDGASLAFARAVGRRYAVYSARLDGSDVTRITSSDADDAPTDWTSSGLLFSRWRLGDPGGDVWVLDVSTGEERRLTRTRSDDFDASWSPDGGRILFTSDRRGNKNVFVMNADGSRPRALTTSAAEDWATDWQPTVR